jgi:four helix bundle protein
MEGIMAKGDDIEARLVGFAVAVLDLCDKLPKSPAGTHIAGQLLRSGSSPAPNYGEVRGAESTKDFVHKLGIVLKELNESRIWLKILRERQMVQEAEVDRVYQECDALCRIIAASRRTAEGNARNRS